MFERFTDRARRVLALAQEEAAALGHNFFGTEHILLGLVRERDGIAGHVLREHGVTFDIVVSHGNAVGVYFRDPEENRLEIYWATGLQARQPYLERVDLAEAPDEIMRKIRQSVAVHGATGIVDRSALAEQNINTAG